MMVNQIMGPLPSKYILLDYIKSTGTQYIDLGITPSDNMEFEIDYQSLAPRATKLFGCETTAKSLFDAYDVGKTQATIRVFAHGGTNGGSPTTITTIAGQKTSLKLIIKNGTYSVYVNGELVATSPVVGAIPNLSIFLFAVNRNGSADGKGSQIIYSCKVKKSGELVGDFKPYLIDGKPGLLNTIDKSFYSNLGTGEFKYEYSIDNYVKDSLMIQLDGIKNTRSGHNANAVEWEDLVGPYGFTKTDKFSFSDNCILVTGQIESKYGVIVPDEYTLEIIYQYSGNANYGIGMEQFSPIFRGRRDTVSWWARQTPDNGDSTRLYYGSKLTVNILHSITITQNANGGKCYYNGILKKSNSDVFSYNGYQKIRNYIGSEVMTGKIYTIRLHKRALTDKEIMQNYEIDKIRFNIPKIYGVSWNGTSTTTWSRTDDAELFTNPVPYIADATSYGSPFDNISPWKDMQIVDDEIAGKLVKIPKYYYKWTKSGNTMKLQISAEPFEESLVSPAHADRGDGNGERGFVYVGRYHCNSSYKSVSSQNPVANITRATARTNIHKLGSSYWQYDYAMYWTIAMLYLVEFADWNSQAKIGYGCSPNGSVVTMGYTDSMPYHTGTTASARTSYGGTQYRYIEGLWDNVHDWCDGIYFGNANVYCIKNPSSFSDTSGGTLVGTRSKSSNFIKSWDVPTASGFEYALYPASVGGASNTYIPDYYYYSSSSDALFVGGSSTKSSYFGLFCQYCGLPASGARSDIGTRLQKLS